MARGADKKPMRDITVSFKHRVKTVFISARRAYFEFISEFDMSRFIVHGVVSTYPDAMACSYRLSGRWNG
jgi:hypothetical protein